LAGKALKAPYKGASGGQRPVSGLSWLNSNSETDKFSNGI